MSVLTISAESPVGVLADGTPYYAPIGAVIVDGSLVTCHLCGRALRSVTAHLRAHGWTKLAYCEAFGLERGQSLEGPETRKLRAVAHWLDTPVQHIREVRSHLLLKLALLDRAGVDPTGLLERQKATLEPIAEAINAESPGSAGFDATLLAWRRATTAATMNFLDDITRATPRAESR